MKFFFSIFVIFVTLPLLIIFIDNAIERSNYDRDWSYAIIHHTATEAATISGIRSYHSTHLGFDTIGYHFVILDNNNGAAIESTERWRYQGSGAHAGDAKLNNKSIGIALVGNFSDSENRPSKKQITSLALLLFAIQKRFGAVEILAHRDVRQTECPGLGFSSLVFKELQQALLDLEQCSEVCLNLNDSKLEDCSPAVPPMCRI